MRPPSLRLADNGTGRDSIIIYTVGIDPDANADSEGNWVKVATPTGVTYTAIVDPEMASGIDADGRELSVTTYNVLVYSVDDPGIREEDPVEWRGLTLVAQGDTVRAAAGAWAFQAVESGPNPDTSGHPYEG